MQPKLMDSHLYSLKETGITPETKQKIIAGLAEKLGEQVGVIPQRDDQEAQEIAETISSKTILALKTAPNCNHALAIDLANRDYANQPFHRRGLVSMVTAAWTGTTDRNDPRFDTIWSIATSALMIAGAPIEKNKKVYQKINQLENPKHKFMVLEAVLSHIYPILIAEENDNRIPLFLLLEQELQKHGVIALETEETEKPKPATEAETIPRFDPKAVTAMEETPLQDKSNIKQFWKLCQNEARVVALRDSNILDSNYQIPAEKDITEKDLQFIGNYITTAIELLFLTKPDDAHELLGHDSQKNYALASTARILFNTLINHKHLNLTILSHILYSKDEKMDTLISLLWEKVDKQNPQPPDLMLLTYIRALETLEAEKRAPDPAEDDPGS